MKKQLVILSLSFSLILVTFATDNKLVYKKILRDVSVDLNKIRAQVEKIIVIEPNYIVIKIAPDKKIPQINLVDVQESDFVQRKIKIIVRDNNELKAILQSGLDIWDKRQGSITGQAFDYQIEELTNIGINVELLSH